MPLQPDQKEEFREWIIAAVPNPKCPFCRDELTTDNIGELIKMDVVNPHGTTHMLQLICGNCAFVSLFSVSIVGDVLKFTPAIVSPK